MLSVVLFAGSALFATEASAQTPDSAESPSLFGTPVFGVFAGYSENFLHTDRLIFLQCPTCGNFDNGNGGGIVLGAFGELPSLWNLLPRTSIYASVDYASRGGTFSDVNTGGLPILDPNTNQYVTLQRKNSSTSVMPLGVIDVGLKVQPFESFPLYLRGTFDIGIPFSSSTSYEQTEEILSPQGVVYPETHTTTRPVASGSFPGVKAPLGVSGALGYPLPIGTDLTAAPEIRYCYPLSSVVPSYSWRVNSVEFGIAFRYGRTEAPPPAPPPAPALPPPPSPPIVAAKPKPPVVALATIASPEVSIVETIVTETFPVLPYLFFDSASAALPSRYVQMNPAEARAFSENNLPNHSLDAYHNLLNIIGGRMASDPSLEITVSGTTDGHEVGQGSVADSLAAARAEVVRSYLANVWKIDTGRVHVTTTSAPTFPSTEEFPEGIAENRRVELSSDNDALLSPILHERFREHVVQPPSVPFTTSTQNPRSVVSWKLTASVKGKTVWQTGGSGAPPGEIDWNLDPQNTNKIAEALNGMDSLHCVLSLTDTNRLTSTNAVSIPGMKSINPFELSRLSLIVFDFDKSDITPQNQRMISHFVAHSILDSSQSTIIGSTDNLGEAKHNTQLSKGRAYAVRDLILKDRPNTEIVKTEGVGSNRQVYSNDLPEGRYYCRTVTVEVETPLSAITK